jgi:RimJ/RimL family protein N-acetyltransferase
MIPTLTTGRLHLREFRESDLDAYAAICASPDVMQFIGRGSTLSRSQTWTQIAVFLGHWQLRGHGMWAVEERSSGDLIGRVGFLDPEGWPGFELGWLLGLPYWGHGFATEAARAALEYAFCELRRRHIISLIYPKNEASIRVALRLGERLERETKLFDRRVLVYGLHKKDLHIA